MGPEIKYLDLVSTEVLMLFWLTVWELVEPKASCSRKLSCSADICTGRGRLVPDRPWAGLATVVN